MNARTGPDLLAANQIFYDELWSRAHVIPAHRFNTWPIVRALLPTASTVLEVAPGLRPRLPIEGTHFLDISEPALKGLQREGGKAVLGAITALPFADASFDIIGAFDVIEHVDDDDAAFTELARVAAAGATLLLSVPLHPAAWTPFDALVGHRRRYRTDELSRHLDRVGFTVARSAPFGMRPQGSRLVNLGMWFLTRHRTWAMWWYNRVFTPIGLRLAKPLRFGTGMVDVQHAAGVILVCHKIGPLKPA